MNCAPQPASADSANQASRRLVGETVLAFAAILLAWCVAWLVKRPLDALQPWFAGGAGSAAYWLLAKALLWLLPGYWLLRRSGRSLREVANLPGWRSWLTWGGAVGTAIALTGVVGRLVRSAPLLAGSLDYATANTLLFAPLFEEFLLRAAVLGNLTPGWGFARANFVSALCFLLLHIPGWFMMGNLAANLTRPIGGAASIFLLGLCFGWVTRRGRSFLAGSVAHALNNLFA